MGQPACSDDEFMELFKTMGAYQLARHLKQDARAVNRRRRRIEQRHSTVLDPPSVTGPDHPARLHLDIEDGLVLIASDAHYWPGVVTTMHRAFVRACKEMQPRAVIMNGDVFDGARISRHSPIMWEESPTVQQELEACRDRLAEIEATSGGAEKIWTFGNHDSRFESRLAAVASEYANVPGLHLKDNFAYWQPCWSAFINDDCVVKHRFKGGIHATHNNTLWSGKSIITGHLHSAKVTPLTDYNGTRWGVDSGTLCEAPWVQAINYLEDNPVNWRSAFVVLTFHKGRYSSRNSACSMRQDRSSGAGRCGMSDDIEDEDLQDIEVAPEEPETPTETVWQRYLKQVPVEESRRFQAIDAARLAECPWDKLVDLAASIEAFLRDGRQVEAKKLRAVKND